MNETTQPDTFTARDGRVWPLASVKPFNYGTEQWDEWLEPMISGSHDRAWADAYLRLHCDQADLRALGFCRTCGQPGALVQVGRCVYFGTCDHYRAQGDVEKMRKFQTEHFVLGKISTERQAALLALIGK